MSSLTEMGALKRAEMDVYNENVNAFADDFRENFTKETFLNTIKTAFRTNTQIVALCPAPELSNRCKHEAVKRVVTEYVAPYPDITARIIDGEWRANLANVKCGVSEFDN